MTGSIDYGGMMHRAVQGLIRQVLGEVARNGLPGEHHFFISFDTTDPGVEIAPWLRERYPENMTIVLQEWFDGLEVDENGFSVTLNFGDQPERMTIPFDAMRSFVDPSVEFGFRFDAHIGPDADAEDEDRMEKGDADAPAEEDSKAADQGGAEVVSLDRWRK